MARFLSVAVALALTLVAGPAAAGLDDEVRYDGAMPSPVSVADSGPYARHGTVLSANGGRVLSLFDASSGGSGDLFLRFPAGHCAAVPCPQAVVRPADSAALMPKGGTGRFSFGADVRLTAEPSPDAGMNVWQFGLAGAGQSQWKLQVDGGRPSCRWSDGTRVVLLPARAYRMAVGRWHRVRCARLSSVLFQIRVLDPVTGDAIVPPAQAVATVGAIRPDGSAVIGGKRVRADQADAQTDQFHGDLDEVYFARR
ncbi:LamG domain-containing protein [Nonomuraea lactucae]|uniref:LamG domain-containing protein n=1 Tax=Nonomuraea lactucae TaxID=2249762 RepID=UPI000DE21A50|nr:LamG domain-containing protein [Nonomuraea lactucae]